MRFTLEKEWKQTIVHPVSGEKLKMGSEKLVIGGLFRHINGVISISEGVRNLIQSNKFLLPMFNTFPAVMGEKESGALLGLTAEEMVAYALLGFITD